MDELAGAGTTIETAECPPLEPPLVSAAFTRLTVGHVCTLVRSACISADIALRNTEDLLIAVSEIVINAICYAGGGGSIALRQVAGGLLAEICDEGPGLPESFVFGHPSAGVPEGHGLWLAQLMCKEFDVVSGPRGVTVRMFMPRRAEAGIDRCLTSHQRRSA